MKIKYQHIRYFPSAVRNGRATWANIFYISSGLRHWKANSMTAMTGRGDNDTSVQSQFERDKTVASNEDGCGRSSRWWNSNEVKCMTVWCVPCRRVLRINSDNRIAWKLELSTNDWYYTDSRKHYVYFCCRCRS